MWITQTLFRDRSPGWFSGELYVVCRNVTSTRRRSNSQTPPQTQILLNPCSLDSPGRLYSVSCHFFCTARNTKMYYIMDQSQSLESSWNSTLIKESWLVRFSRWQAAEHRCVSSSIEILPAYNYHNHTHTRTHARTRTHRVIKTKICIESQQGSERDRIQ